MVASWWPCCCGGGTSECTYCDGGTGPAQFTVTISGLSDDITDPCPTCSNLNGTYVCDFVTEGVSFCQWRLELDSDICGVRYVDVIVSNSNTLSVQLIAGIGTTVTFSTIYADPVLCMDLTNEQVFYSFVSGELNSCDWSEATITVSA